jgi:hypothetical protein
MYTDMHLHIAFRQARARVFERVAGTDDVQMMRLRFSFQK